MNVTQSDEGKRESHAFRKKVCRHIRSAGSAPNKEFTIYDLISFRCSQFRIFKNDAKHLKVVLLRVKLYLKYKSKFKNSTTINVKHIFIRPN